MSLADLAERYEEAGLDVLAHNQGHGRIDFEGNFEGQSGIGRSLGRLALEHGYAVMSFERNNTAAPSVGADFIPTTTVWFDRIEVETRTETVEVEKEVGVVYHERGHAVIDQ